MRITKIDLLHSEPVEDGWRPLFVRVYTDEGIYGDGEVALSYGGIDQAAFGMLRNMAPMLIGMNPLENEKIWNKLYYGCFWGYNGGPVVFGAISAFDLAMWDIRGKKFGVPIWMLLGGKMRSSLRAYASQLQMGWGTGRQHCTSSDDYAKATRIAMDKGFDAVKINFTTFREDGTPYDKFEQAPYLTADYLDVIEERLKAVRDTLGPNGDIILENHSLTDKLSATQMGNMAKRYRIMYFEEPTAPHADNLAYVHEHTGIPVATGERMYSRWQFKDYLEKGAVQVIQPDLGTCGGITEVKKICDLAYIYEAAVQIHVCGSPLITAASLHMEAAIPGFIIHEYNVNTEMPRMLGLTTRTYEPVNGKMPVPDLPGIGNEIAPETFSHSEVIHVE
ncbi:MAG: mandelate racemase/muconate lactonizing enzyme family protein [Eubacteriales bacterium]|jgi:L-alanine-DL-glutamate epimerase-like enolase superfamily enzyme|nr:mandelate racemase/muconate lactonizing enzyme family protein [Lachnospiraceae bacterium]MDD5860869.1 mandelate racemase/muconate lactonizing enzyme family protein [Eubacteriales bacterium]